MKQQWVSDNARRQLDQRAGALTRRQRRRVVAASAAVVAIVLAGFAIDRSGSIWARASCHDHTGLAGSASVKPPLFAQEIPVKNTGWTTIRVTGIGQDGPGLEPGPARGHGGDGTGLAELQGASLPFDLHPGQTVILAIGYRVTDCDAVLSSPFPIAVRIERPWGTQTIGIAMPQQEDRSSIGASTSRPTIEINPPGVEWQKAAADQACHPELN